MARIKGEYTLSSTAWPRHIWDRGENNVVEEILVTIESVDGVDLFADFPIRFYTFKRISHHENDLHPQMQIFHDGWESLDKSGLLHELTTLKQPDDPRQIINLLESLGFVPSEYNGQERNTDQNTDGRGLQRTSQEP